MKTFTLVVKLKAHEGHRIHVASLKAASLEFLLDWIKENLAGKFFAIEAYHGGFTSEYKTHYTVIINTAEVIDIMIDEVTEE